MNCFEDIQFFNFAFKYDLTETLKYWDNNYFSVCSGHGQSRFFQRGRGAPKHNFV